MGCLIKELVMLVLLLFCKLVIWFIFLYISIYFRCQTFKSKIMIFKVENEEHRIKYRNKKSFFKVKFYINYINLCCFMVDANIVTISNINVSNIIKCCWNVLLYIKIIYFFNFQEMQVFDFDMAIFCLNLDV